MKRSGFSKPRKPIKDGDKEIDSMFNLSGFNAAVTRMLIEKSKEALRIDKLMVRKR